MMKPSMWIDRYVFAVGRLLPERKRADIELEIRSLIHDELEGAGLSAESEDDEAALLTILSNFGRPEEMAARYDGPRYLIGPALYPIFRTVAGVLIAVMVGVGMFGLAIAVGVRSSPIQWGETFSDLAGSILQMLGVLVLIFGIIEAANRQGSDQSRKPWDPRTLRAVEAQDRVKVGEMVAGIIAALIAIILVNGFASQLTGSFVKVDGEWETFAVLSPNALRFVPWLTVMWLLDVALKVFVLAQGVWRPLTRWLEFGLSLLGAAIFFAILTDGPLAANPMVEPAFKVTAAIIFAIIAVEAIAQFYHLLTRRRPERSAGSLSHSTAPR